MNALFSVAAPRPIAHAAFDSDVSDEGESGTTGFGRHERSTCNQDKRIISRTSEEDRCIIEDKAPVEKASRPGQRTRRRPPNISDSLYHPPKPTRPRPPLHLTGAGRDQSVVGQLRWRWKEVLIWCMLGVLAIIWTFRAHETHKHRAVRGVRLGQRIRWAARYLISLPPPSNYTLHLPSNLQASNSPPASLQPGRFPYLTRADGLGHDEAGKYDVVLHAWVIAALAEYAAYEKSGWDTVYSEKLDDVNFQNFTLLLLCLMRHYVCSMRVVPALEQRKRAHVLRNTATHTAGQLPRLLLTQHLIYYCTDGSACG